MQIRTVSFRQLVTGPGYTNKALEATADVQDGETPEDAVVALSAWVRSQLGEGGACTSPEALREEVNFLHRQKQQLRGAISGDQLTLKKLRDEIVSLEVKRENLGGEPAMPF